MNTEHLLIVTSEPKSVFLELIFKYLNLRKKISKKITLIGNSDLILREAKKSKFKLNLNKIFDINKAKKNKLNLIEIPRKKKGNIFNNSRYISNSFKCSLSILEKNKKAILLNGPLNKETFLKKKYLGVTEYLAKKTRSKNSVMLIFNKKLSVSPITTHLPIRLVAKNINKNKIINNVKSINNFYTKYLRKKPKFAILGLNPHCETIDDVSEEQKVISPAIIKLKQDCIFVEGPFSADTFFIKRNINKFDVVIGMYHDQVLTPLKTLFNFDAINITIGLPFLRISPDHGPNLDMYGKNKSDPASIFCAMEFINQIK